MDTRSHRREPRLRLALGGTRMLARPAHALVLAAFCAASLATAQAPAGMEKSDLANAGFEQGEAGHAPMGWTHHKGRRCGGSG